MLYGIRQMRFHRVPSEIPFQLGGEKTGRQNHRGSSPRFKARARVEGGGLRELVGRDYGTSSLLASFPQTSPYIQSTYSSSSVQAASFSLQSHHSIRPSARGQIYLSSDTASVRPLTDAPCTPSSIADLDHTGKIHRSNPSVRAYDSHIRDPPASLTISTVLMGLSARR